MAQLQSSKQPKQGSDFLFSIQQEGEFLCHYMDHFKAAMLEVHSLEPSVAMSALKKGLHGGIFYFFLSKKFSRNLLSSWPMLKSMSTPRKAW